MVASRASPRVLLVDDEPGMLELTRLLIEDAFPHAEVLCAATPSEGLLRMGDADVIVSDFRMVEMDGIELLGHAKHVPPHRKILLTGMADPEVRRRAQKAGVGMFVEKTHRSDVLLDAVRAALR